MLSTLNGSSIDDDVPINGSSLDDVRGIIVGKPTTHAVENNRSSDIHAVDNGLLSTTRGNDVDRQSFGCKIDRVEMRGITIKQLETLLSEVEEKCKKGEMKHENKVCDVDNVTFIHIYEDIIIPRTKEKQCSFIETIATSEQKTTWCVVFRPTQSFKDIVIVLKQHSKDRELKPTDCYWIHLLADNPWSLPGDINDNFSALPRAMKLAKGTICVIDSDCRILKHLWSLMDIYLAVQRKKDDGAYMLDFYTTIANQIHSKFAVGLTDGLIHSDFNSLVKKSDFNSLVKKSDFNSWVKKSEREAEFPLKIIKEAFNVDVKTAKYDEDQYIKRFVMNAITEIPRNDNPMEIHEKYDDFNKILGGIFVSSSLDRLLREDLSDEELYRYLEALKLYAPTSISLDLSNINHKEKFVTSVFKSLPSSIQRVHINLTKNRIDKGELFNFIKKLIQLNALGIYGVDLDAYEVKNILEKHNNSITSLALVDCSINDNDVEKIIEEIQQCKSLEELDLSENPILEKGLRHINEMLVNFSRTIKLRLFKKEDTKLLTNYEAMKDSLKQIMPYHFSSDTLYEVDKYYYHNNGCRIERAENRGITIKQLEIVVEEMEALFNDGKFKHRGSVDKVTIVDIFPSIIKRRTELKKVSYVERIALREQRPRWCVTFIWAQSVKGMMDILRQHSKDRDLKDTDSYWINAFANNPWNIAGDVNDFYSSLPRAMSLSVGHVLIIDTDYKILTRLWCLYDIYLAIKRKEKGYKIDFYKNQESTVVGSLHSASTVVGITDGFILSDLKHDSDECFDLKSERDSQFPIDFFQSVLQIDVKSAEARDSMDKTFIRNIICNQQRNATPLKRHKKYDDFNDTVAGFFIAASLQRLLEKYFKVVDNNRPLLSHDQLLKYFGVLKKSIATDISCVLMENNKDIADKLFSSLPSSLQTLYFKMNSKDPIVDLYKLSELIPNFKKMRELTINGAKLRPSSISAICKCLVKESSEMKLEKLSLINCDLKNVALKVLFTALNSNKYLKELDLSDNNFFFDFKTKEDMKKTIEILEETAITKMNLTKNKLDCPYILLNMNKRFRSMKVNADTYQTPKTSDFLIEEDTSAVINDVSKGGIDRLGFKVYAEAIKSALVLASIPICVGIYGKWGSGKSFLLELMKKEFDSNVVENLAKDGLIQWFQDEWIEVKLKNDTNGIDKEGKGNCCKGFFVSTIRLFFYNYTVVTIYSLISDNLFGNAERSTVLPNDVESNSMKIEKEYLFVTFNALEYAESDELYAGLIRALYEITEKRLSEHNSEAYFKAYDYKENKPSVDYLRTWRIKRAKDLLLEQFGGREQLLASLIAFVLLVIGTILFIILDAYHVIKLKDIITWSTNSYTSIATYLGFIVTLVPSISLLYGANRTSVISRGDAIYQEASDQNLRDNIGFLNKVVNELKDLFEFMKEFRDDTNIDLTLVVFVDDLDRCFNGRVVKVLEVIQLLISIPSSPVILFLALDTSIVVPGIEEVINKSIGIRDSLTTGWSYLEKIIQLPFCLPQPLPNILKEFISMTVRKNIIDLNERVIERLQKLIQRISDVHDKVRLDNMDTELTYFVLDSHQHKRKFNFDRLRDKVEELIKASDNKDTALAILKSASELLGKDQVHAVSHEKDNTVKKQLIENMLFHLLVVINSVSIDSDKHTKNECDKNRVNNDYNEGNYGGNMSKSELFNKKLITIAQNQLRNLKTDDFSLPGHIRSLISSLSDYIDKNPRKIKRIINMLLLVFEVAKRKEIKDEFGVTSQMITELYCWTLFSRKLTLWIVLCEVYPYRMSMLVSRLIDFEQQLECNQHTKHSSIDIFYKARAEDIHEDIKKIDEMTVSRFYFCYVESYIYTIESAKKMLRIDGDPANFTRLLSFDISLITLEPKYLLCKDILGYQYDNDDNVIRRNDRQVDFSILAYSFNLDPSIREQINIEISELTTDYELSVRQKSSNISDDANTTTVETQISQHAGKSVLRKNHVERKQDIIMKTQNYNSYNSSDEHSHITINSPTNYGSIH